ncbi:MAG: sigma-54-dependent Fis family transcriptional regulator [Deltaproteobacteria bacterium]|nr:sigma-54-dependent Fis family transcriptional regulator [Candidatus Anaeroferrophillacea bacterium]
MVDTLIIDDDQQFCSFLETMVTGLGHRTVTSFSAGEGREAAGGRAFDIVFLDINLPDGNGLDMLQDIAAGPGSPEVIMITGMGDPDSAELAIRNGAWDYIQKGDALSSLKLPFLRAVAYRQEKLKARQPVSLKIPFMVGSCPAMQESCDLVAAAAHSGVNVLVTGESGTGKELIARAIHQNGPRAAGNFVVVDCAAMPDHLIESVLFGHEKGSFTGAAVSRSGLVAEADGGVLFLDEIAELPPDLQKVFLRVLQERRYRVIGSCIERTSDFQLIAATNKDLDCLVREERFREDLLYRVRAMAIDLPPLRERGTDIKAVTRYHLARICDRTYGKCKCCDPEVYTAFESYEWPGNIRELINALEYACAMAGAGETIMMQHLPLSLRVAATRQRTENRGGGDGELAHPDNVMELEDSRLPPLDSFRRSMDKLYLQRLLAATEGDMQQAAKVAGISRSTLYALQKRVYDA